MKYFLLDMNPACTKAPKLINPHEFIQKRNITPSKYSTIKKRVVLNIESSTETVFADVLTAPFLLLSEKVYKITKEYNQVLPNRQVVLLDTQNKIAELYFLPVLPVVDCMSEKSELNLGKTKLIKPLINADKVPEKHMFWFKNFNSNLPVITLDLAESILRRNARGICLTPIEFD